MSANRKRTTFISFCFLLLIIAIVLVSVTLKKRSSEKDGLTTEDIEDRKEKVQEAQTLPPPDIKVPPEPLANKHNSEIQRRPDSIPNASSSFPTIDPNVILLEQWEGFLKKDPSRIQLTSFLQRLEATEIFGLMEYISQVDPQLASAMFSYDVIPSLKQRWSEDGQRWEENAPYDWLLALASDTGKPPLFRMVMVDILGTGSREATDQSIRTKMSGGLAAIGQSASDSESVRIYAINKLGIITPPDEESPHAGLLRALAVDKTEPGSLRGASITALSHIGNKMAVPMIQRICDEYQPENDPELARASVVALGDFGRRYQAPALDHILNVLTKTENRDVHASAMHAISLLDDAQFAESLPEIMETSGRFEADSHTRNSLTAVLWAHPDAVVVALNSDDDEAVQAAIQAATIVPLPPARARMEQLLKTRPAEEQQAIKAALEKTNDTATYEMIVAQNAKAKEE
jgi:hypothetical protein